MKRYFIGCSYRGSNYSGWQSQPNAPTIQDAIEERMEKLMGKNIPIIGCGRTDAGVHASDYVFHFDTEDALDDHFIFKMNMMLPKDIALKNLNQVPQEAHARFDAVSRSYEYYIHGRKDPFLTGLSYYYPHLFRQDLQALQEVASIYLKYKDFNTFCKSKTDVKTTLCEISQAEWMINGNKLVFHITANRFLRGMVRLMVGACINVVLGKLSIEEVKAALEEQRRLKKDLSVPAEGLYLSAIKYPQGLI